MALVNYATIETSLTEPVRVDEFDFSAGTKDSWIMRFLKPRIVADLEYIGKIDYAPYGIPDRSIVGYLKSIGVLSIVLLAGFFIIRKL